MSLRFRFRWGLLGLGLDKTAMSDLPNCSISNITICCVLGYRKPMSLFPHFFFFFFFLFFLSVLVVFADHDHDQQTLKLELLHRHHPEVIKKLYGNSGPKTLTDRLVDIHSNDVKRHQIISQTLYQSKVQAKSTDSQPSSSTPASLGLTMHSGSGYGMGEYVVHLKVGTPPRSFMLIVDTGSELTWIKCRYRRCTGNCSTSHSKRSKTRERFNKSFLANLSSSFKTIDCSSQMCKDGLSGLFSVKECPTPTSPCVYHYTYLSGPTATGIFATETLTVDTTEGKEVQLHDSIVGCTEAAEGKNFRKSHGVLALGFGPHSFLGRAYKHTKGGFSYCLVDHLSHVNQTNYFLIGSANNKIPSIQTGEMQYTKLLTGGPYSSFYGVDLAGISVDGVMLKIPPRVWDIGYDCGTILDSGSSLTILTAPAYDLIVDAMLPSLSHLPRLKIPPFDFCFNNTNLKLDSVPKLGFHFRDGAVLEPPTKSYLITVGPDGVSCIGIVSVRFPGNNVLGNIIQQNHLWQYDFTAHRVGFAKSQCL